MATQTKSIGPFKVKYGSREEMLEAKARERAARLNTAETRRAYEARLDDEWHRKFGYGRSYDEIDLDKEDLSKIPNDVFTEHVAKRLYNDPVRGPKHSELLRAREGMGYDEYNQWRTQKQRERARKNYSDEQKAKKDADARRTSAAKSTRKRADNVDHIARHKAEMEEINKRNAERSRANATATAAGFSTRKRTDNVNTVPIEEYKPKKQKRENLASVAAKGFDSAW